MGYGGDAPRYIYACLQLDALDLSFELEQFRNLVELRL